VTSFDRGRVYRLGADGTLLDSLALAGPIGVSLDWRRRRAWIADAAGDAVVAVDMDTRQLALRVTGLHEPRDVAVDLASGEAWVAAFLDGAVVRLSPAGVERARVSGFAGPYALALDPGVR
jgi:DNA-binding beta-propeller fold protein YncE